MADYLDLSGVRQIAESMDPQFLECRTGRHVAKPENSVLNTAYGYRHNTYRCACGLVKHEITQAEFPFKVLDSYSDYPEGYLIHGFGQLVGESRDVLKGVRMQRVFNRSNTTRMGAREARNTPPPRSKAKEALGVTDEVIATVTNIHSKRKAS